MPGPNDELTRLQRIIRLGYAMQPEDEKALAGQLLSQRSTAWRGAIEDEARRLGVKRPVGPPRGVDLDDLRRMSLEDARSIVRTYNADLQSEIQRLYAANPRGNRQYYISNLERWHAKRSEWKNRQIALQTNKTARYAAQQRFKELNRITTQYRFTGPAPVCDDCAAQFAAGVVDQKHVDRNSTPLHPNCPHEWAMVAPRAGVPLDELWIGD